MRVLTRGDVQVGRKIKESTVESIGFYLKNWPHRKSRGRKVISGRGTNRQRHGAYTEK